MRHHFRPLSVLYGQNKTRMYIYFLTCQVWTWACVSAVWAWTASSCHPGPRTLVCSHSSTDKPWRRQRSRRACRIGSTWCSALSRPGKRRSTRSTCSPPAWVPAYPFCTKSLFKNRFHLRFIFLDNLFNFFFYFPFFVFLCQSLSLRLNSSASLPLMLFCLFLNVPLISCY